MHIPPDTSDDLAPVVGVGLALIALIAVFLWGMWVGGNDARIEAQVVCARR